MLGVEAQLSADDVVVDASLVGQPVDVLERLAEVLGQLGRGPQLARHQGRGGPLAHTSPYAGEPAARASEDGPRPWKWYATGIYWPGAEPVGRGVLRVSAGQTLEKGWT